MRKVFAFLRGKYRWFAMIAILCAVGEVAMETMMPIVITNVLNLGVAHQDMIYTLKAGGQIVLMAVTSLCFGMLAAWLSSNVSVHFGRDLRRVLFRKIQAFSFSNLDRFGTSSLITRLTTDVSRMEAVSRFLMRSVPRCVLMVVLASTMAFSIHRRLSLAFVLIAPLLGIVVLVIRHKSRPLFQAMLQSMDHLNQRVQENLVGVRVVKAFVSREREEKSFFRAADVLRRNQVRAERLSITVGPIMQMMLYLSILLIYWFGGRMITVGEMQPGDLTGFIIYANQILNHMVQMISTLNYLVMSRTSADRIMEVMEETPDIVDVTEEDPAVADGSISFRDVSFRYDGNRENEVLSHIQLEIASGETVGIIGGTGSSKSTLVQLIPRLYEAHRRFGTSRRSGCAGVSPDNASE